MNNFICICKGEEIHPSYVKNRKVPSSLILTECPTRSVGLLIGFPCSLQVLKEGSGSESDQMYELWNRVPNKRVLLRNQTFKG